MSLSKIPVGNNAPDDINVVIEVPMNSDPVKYEFDKDSGFLFVDRFIATPMYYPCNYGFIPNTLSEDGDPADVLVVSRYAIIPGSVVNARPIGVLVMEDEKGKDEKIIAVPSKYKYYEDITDISDLPASFIDEISHFFEHYKDLEKGKWVKISGFENGSVAKDIIKAAVALFKSKSVK